MVLLGVLGNESLRREFEVIAGWRSQDGRWLMGDFVTGTGSLALAR